MADFTSCASIRSRRKRWPSRRDFSPTVSASSLRAPPTPPRVPPCSATADAILTQHAPVDAAVLAAAPRVRLIQKYGGREDGLDLQAAQAAGVQVALMPLRGCIAVAELAMTLILALSKNLIVAHRETVEGGYRSRGLSQR